MAQNVPSRLELLVAQARRTGCPKKAVQEFVNTMVKLETQPMKKKAENSTAYNRGRIDADGVSLARQMTGSGTRRIGDW